MLAIRAVHSGEHRPVAKSPPGRLDCLDVTGCGPSYKQCQMHTVALRLSSALPAGSGPDVPTGRSRSHILRLGWKTRDGGRLYTKLCHFSLPRPVIGNIRKHGAGPGGRQNGRVANELCHRVGDGAESVWPQCREIAIIVDSILVLSYPVTYPFFRSHVRAPLSRSCCAP